MILWLDGFDAYGVTANAAPAPAGIMARKYSAIASESSFKVRAGRYSGYALNLPYDTFYFGKTGLTTEDTVIAGFAINFVSLRWPSYQFFGLYAGATRGVWLRRTTNGLEIEVMLGGGVIATTSGVNFTAGVWQYLEIKVKCDSSAGTVDIQSNGSSVLSASSLNTKAGSNSYHDGFRHYGIDVNLPMIDDFYFLDSSGAANNDFLGKQKIVTLFPDDVGDANEWSGSSGADHYTLVGENPTDNDTTYVESSESTKQELWKYSDSLDVGTIAGLKINTDCRVTDVTSFNLGTLIQSGATGVSDAGQTIGATGFTTPYLISEQDPNTVAAWGASGVNNAQFGVKVV